MLLGLEVLAVVVVGWSAIYYLPRLFRVGIRRSHYRGRRGRPNRTSFMRKRDGREAE